MNDTIAAEARRYLEKAVMGWDDLPPYVQDLMVGKLANHANGWIDEELQNGTDGDSTIEPKGLLPSWEI